MTPGLQDQCSATELWRLTYEVTGQYLISIHKLIVFWTAVKQRFNIHTTCVQFKYLWNWLCAVMCSFLPAITYTYFGYWGTFVSKGQRAEQFHYIAVTRCFPSTKTTNVKYNVSYLFISLSDFWERVRKTTICHNSKILVNLIPKELFHTSQFPQRLWNHACLL